MQSYRFRKIWCISENVKVMNNILEFLKICGVYYLATKFGIAWIAIQIQFVSVLCEDSLRINKPLINK